MVVRNLTKFKLAKIIKDFSESRNLKLFKLSPKNFSESYEIMYSSDVQEDKDFIRDVGSCISFADSYHKNGFILSTLDNKFLNICYLGQLWGTSHIYGSVTNQKSKIVYSPSEKAIIEDTNKRLDISANESYICYSLRDKTLERLIRKIHRNSYPSYIKIHREELRTESTNPRFISELISGLF